MAVFVLVHGGWHGGWCWRAVEKRLRANGHDVFCPTMTGLSERSHLIDVVDGPDTHVTDIVNVLRWNELDEVILVGHSYGGMIITGVATQIPEQIKHLVYLDAFVPTKNHQAATSMATFERAAEIAEAAAGNKHIPPNGFERWTSDPQQLEWLKRMTTSHPGSCFGQGVAEVIDPSTQDFSRTYILAAQHDPSPFQQFYAKYKDDPRWVCQRVDCLHDVMVERPGELVGLLEQCV